MELLLKLFILIPLLGFGLSLLLAPEKESLIAWTALLTGGLQLVGVVAFLGLWLLQHQPTLHLKDIVLFKTSGYEFFIAFGFDRITAVYLLVGAILTFLVAVYSRNYLHRESGFKRFFNTILFFYAGYNLVILSGNLETLFIGWEMLGISSFLLIAFYRDRYLPVKNAVKVFSVYRIGDVGLILAMWMSHHLWHENITFLMLSNFGLVHAQLQSHSLTGIFISLMLLVSAAAKSAQLPFSSWLPRAMEGPTPSSAIFYGALSVHMGVFLLMRTFPFWEHQLSVRILIGLLGLSTSLLASGMARVQSSVKSQIAYSSMAQIGLMFIEVAAGWSDLALVHFAGNAFLRTYQLLVSPSVVTYLIREQFYNFTPRAHKLEATLPKKIAYSIYMLCLQEWRLESFLYRCCWNPLKWAGRKMDFLTFYRVLYIFIPAYLMGLYLVYHRSLIPAGGQHSLSFFFAGIALIKVLKSFTERRRAQLAWLLVVMSYFWVALAISFNEPFSFDQVHLFLSGVAMCGLIGFLCLRSLKDQERHIGLQQFHGHAYKHPKLALLFLLACLGVSGFPITPTFVGEDLIFSHIHEGQALLAFLVSLAFIIGGIAIIRIYARVFLGPHVKSVYEMAYRSS